MSDVSLTPESMSPPPPDLPLDGCPPEPLLAYLKALGVFRLVAEQADTEARCFWRGDVFHLRSSLAAPDLCAFFLDAYRPTPIVAPWNGGSGFFAKDNQQALQAIAASLTPRLSAYRETIARTKVILGDSASTKPEKKEKQGLLRRLRSRLPDSALPWLDVAAAETDEHLAFSPLLGTGGNDGRLEFTQNFMQRVGDIVLNTNRALNEGRLQMALFGLGDSPLTMAAVGQFDPGGVGGPNGRPGFEAGSLVNPWDFVLMLEGSLFFLGSVARRFGGRPQLRGSFPFTVQPTAAGWGTMATTDGRDARAEIWLPLWPRPASLVELRRLFAEGRAQVGRRTARTGVDVARAVVSLGVDRGIAAFDRYGFQPRSGKNYLAIPLGRLSVEPRAHVDLLADVDGWLNELRRVTTTQGAPDRYARALRTVEDAIFAYCQYGGVRRLQAVLASLGSAERNLAVPGPAHALMRPLPGLSPEWVRTCADGSPEYRIAVALAAIAGASGPIRRQLEAVAPDGKRWKWADGARGVAWEGESLSRNLAAILARRMLEAEQGERREGAVDGPNPALRSHATVALGDVQRFLHGQVDDARIADLLWALAAIRWEAVGRDQLPASNSEDPADLPRAYALLKLMYLPVPLLSAIGEPVAIPADPAVLSRLRAGDLPAATRIAYRRLHARGFQPFGEARPGRLEPPDFVCPAHVQSRLAAALLIPIVSTGWLVRLVLRPAPPAASPTG